jgi:hypothetical protein
LLASLNVKLNATGGFSTNQNLQSATFYKTNYFSDLLNGNTSSGNFKVYQIGNGLYYVGPVGGTFSLEDDNGASRLSAGIFDFSYGVYYTGQLLLDSGQLWDLANGVPAIIFGDDHLLNDSGGNIALDFNARILMGGWTAFGDLSIAAGYNNKINFDRTDTTSFARFVFYTGGDEMWDFGMRGDAANPNDLSFTVFGDPRLTLTKTTARMGVNTSNPQFTLDVNGTFNSRGAASFGASLYASNGIVSLSSNKLAVTTVSVSGSPFHFTNTFSKNIVVLLSRGELQGVGVNNSLWSAALTNGVVPVPLEINEWVSITNTVAPTMKWKPN